MSATPDEQEAEIRRLLGPIYDKSKRLCRMLADRRTPEDDEAAGVFAAVLYKLANAEAANARAMQSDGLSAVVPRVLSVEMAKALHETVRIRCEPDAREASILNDRAVWDALLKAGEASR